jgi:hypothetical protein
VLSSERGFLPQGPRAPCVEHDQHVFNVDRAAAVDIQNGVARAPTADVLWLRYVVGLTAHQTVEVLGRSERTVRREWLFGIGWLREERAAQ